MNAFKGKLAQRTNIVDYCCCGSVTNFQEPGVALFTDDQGISGTFNDVDIGADRLLQ